MAKNLNEEYRVSMRFDADTKAAQAQIQKLFDTLNKISTTAPKTFDLSEFQKASEAAQNLKKHLDAAVNTNTGKLDLSKFSQSLSKSNQSLNDIYKSLNRIGPEGQKAFLQLAATITNADNSIFTLNKRIKELGVTLKNTVKWQISSSLTHGFVGAIQRAYGYAQNLNESLNNIRIVTGQSIEQMERFAATANKAAKALSTSTLSYTDAALIYYQQGLSDQEVKARTDVTVKMANVTGDTAEKVSQQLTAVWNNFAKGSDNLEYFADVMTALGAATASSTDEISEGLEKFSAVAQTVGLSYEYATAALATVTATTRESASVVGNAFKTLFARLEGLKLGETLDDGTDLNKYSQALATIGVNIKDASGQLRAMDDILDDMAKRWGTLDKATQMATAQAVGGVRQYNTLIALMENWDFMQENLNTARNATGELQKQADIYAESWEAAQKRVQASLEKIYTTIIDDKAFIGLTDTLAGTINVIGNVIEGLGGVKGILLLISSIVMNTYAKEIPKILTTLTNNINVLTGAAERNKQSILTSLGNIMRYGSFTNSKSSASQAEIQSIKTVTQMTIELNNKRKDLSQTEIAAYEQKIKMIQAYGKSATAIGREIDALEKESKSLERQITYSLRVNNNWSFDEGRRKGQITRARNAAQTVIDENTKKNIGYKAAITKWQNQNDALAAQKDLTKEQKRENRQTIEENNVKIKERTKLIRENEKAIADAKARLEELDKIGLVNGSHLIQNLKQQSSAFAKMQIEINKASDYTKQWQQDFDEADNDPKKIKEIENEIQKYLATLKAAGIDTSEFFGENGALKSFDEVKELLEGIDDINNKSGISFQQAFENIEKTGQALIQLGADEEQVRKLIDDLRDGTISAEEFKIKMQELARQEQDTINHTIEFSEALGLMAGTLTQIAMAINAIKNLGNIWNDDDLSTGEKILQTMTSLSMIIPVITTLTNLEKMSKLSAAAATILHMNVEKMSIPIKIASGTATEFALAPLLIFVGIIGVVVGGIIAISKAIETNTEKLKRLKKEQEELNEVVEKANQEWDEFKNNLSGYDEAAKGLAKLTQGTSDFNEELQKANTFAKELIAKLPLAFGEDYFYNEQGLLTFTQSGQEKINKANQQIAFGQKALSWAQYQKDREILAQNAIVDSDARKKEKYNYVKSRFGVSYGTNVNWTSFEDEILKRYADQNGNVNLDNLSVSDIAQYAKSAYLGNLDEDKADAFATYVIESLKEQNRTTAFSSNNYSNEKRSIAELLGANNPYANIIASSFFGSQQEVDEQIQNARNKIASSNIDQLWKDTYGMLLQEDQDKLIDQYKTKENALVPAILSSIYEGLATTKASDIEHYSKNFSDKNKNVITNILTNSLENISPEDIKNIELSEQEQQAFASIFNALYDKNLQVADVNDYISDIQNKTYDPVKYYQNQIKGVQELQESIKELNKAFGSLKFGDTVDSIEGLSEEAASYFTVMADGTYKLTGSAEEFQRALLAQERQGFRDNIANAEALEQTYYEAYGRNPTSFAQINEHNQARITGEQAKSINQYGLAMTATDVEDLNQLLYDGEIELDHYTAAWSLLEQEKDLKGLDTEQLSNYIKYLQEAEDMSEEAADTVARSSMKMSKGVDSLVKNFEAWSEALAENEKGSQAYFDALSDMRTAIADLLDISEDHLSDAFLTSAESMELMQKAAEGDKDAIELLRASLSDALFEQYALGVDWNQFSDNFANSLVSNYEAAKEAIQNSPVGASIDISGYLAQLNEMIAAGELTVDQVNGMLDAMGVDAQYEVQEVDLPQTITHTTKTQVVRDISGSNPNAPKAYQITETSTTNTETVPGGSISVPGISYGKGKKPQITGVIKKANSSYAPSITPKTSGGGKTGQAKQNSEVERYHEVKSILKDLETEYGRISKARERAFGQGQLKLYDQEISKLDEIIAADERYLAEARGWLELDMEKANEAARTMGFDEFNDQTNWTQIQYKLNDYYNENILNSNDEKLEKQWEQWKSWIDKAVNSHETVLEREDAWIDHMNERQDKLYDKWNKEIELKVDLDERSRKLIDLKLKQLGDSFYKKVEAAWLLFEKMGLASNGTMDLSKAQDDAAFLQGKYDEIAGLNLSPQQQYEAYSTIMDKSIESASALLDLREQMMDYYGEAISQMREEWNQADSQFSHLNTVLEHYNKLLDLTGQGKDYDKRLTILNGQLDVQKNQLEVHKQELSILEEEERRRNEDYQNALASGNEYAISAAKKYLDTAKENVRELSKTVQQDIENIAQTAQDILTTSLEKIYKEYEKKLTNGVGYDYLNQIMDLQAEKADLVLTETNKLYETNKMIRNLERDMDKITNTAAKNRLNAFKQEIKVLQERGELTHFELEDAQLRYEVLKAQIALEEAQNAKSTVRLQRDSEGNFGYVYTGDKQSISEAQDNLDKANNDRYNHALEAQEEFLRQYYNKQKEFQDALNELDQQRLDGVITEEEYQQRKVELINYYAPLLETLEKNHVDALDVMNETSAQHINDSWTASLIGEGYGLQGKTEQWRNESVRLVGEVGEAFNTWKDTIDTYVEPEVTGDLNAMRDAVKEVTDKSQELRDYMINELLPAQDKELLELDDLIKKWLAEQEEIEKLIEWYKQLATEACSAIQQIEEAIQNLPQDKTITITTNHVDNYTTNGSTGNTGGSKSTPNSYKVEIEGPDYPRIELLDWSQKAENGQWTDYYLTQQLKKNIPYLNESGWHAYLNGIKLFNTGGYTGEWGPAGKLAMLHEKELVLNAEDTKNFLAGIQMLRQITSVIDLQAAAMGAMDTWSSLAAPAGRGTLDQNVTIHAEFPNVTQHNEIELALADLVNRASQYANRY